MGAFVIAFANVTRQQWKHFLDTECGADEKAIAYIWGTDLSACLRTAGDGIPPIGCFRIKDWFCNRFQGDPPALLF